jgi:hypothetical protein
MIRSLEELRPACCGLAALVTLGDTLYAWREEIAAVCCFIRNNGITCS